MRVFMHVMNCKPYGVPPTLFWTLDLVAWGWGLVAWCLGPDFGVGLVLEGSGLEVCIVWHVLYAVQVKRVRIWLVLATF